MRKRWAFGFSSGTLKGSGRVVEKIWKRRYVCALRTFLRPLDMIASSRNMPSMGRAALSRSWSVMAFRTGMDGALWKSQVAPEVVWTSPGSSRSGRLTIWLERPSFTCLGTTAVLLRRGP